MKNLNYDDVITLCDAITEGPSKAIENQEKRGQENVVKNQLLPKKTNDLSIPKDALYRGTDNSMSWSEKGKIFKENNIEYTKQQYEKMGIIIIDEYDDLFWNVKLPDGWEIKKTSHSMWNELFDNKNRQRATFFYKAAFYDRDAFINFNTRFHVSVNHIADPASDYDVWKKSDFQGIVKDSEKIIFSTQCVSPTDDYFQDSAIQKVLEDELKEYMNKHYPNYKDINAYWEKK